MTPLRTPRAIALGRPPSMSADECGTLYVEPRQLSGYPEFVSRWRPSREDLVALIGGADICLSVIGGSHPPVLLYVAAAVPGSVATPLDDDS